MTAHGTDPGGAAGEFDRRSLLLGSAGLAAAATAGGIAMASPALAADKTTPLSATRFSLTVDGHELALFQEVDGLKSEVDVIEFRSGAEESDTQIIPGRIRPGSVTLKRGVTASLEIAAWHELVVAGEAGVRRPAVLQAVGSDGSPVARWNFRNAWPSKLEYATVADKGLLLETVTIVCERIQRVSV